MHDKMLKSVVSAAVLLSAERLGYDNLRPGQEDASVNFLLGNDVFVNLPTGLGMSLCYAVLPVASDIIRRRKQWQLCTLYLDAPYASPCVYSFQVFHAHLCINSTATVEPFEEKRSGTGKAV